VKTKAEFVWWVKITEKKRWVNSKNGTGVNVKLAVTGDKMRICCCMGFKINNVRNEMMTILKPNCVPYVLFTLCSDIIAFDSSKTTIL